MDRVLIAGPVVLLIALAAGASAQQSDTLSVGTHEVEARWLHGDQSPGPVRFEPSSLRFRLDAVELGAGRSYDFTAYRERTGPTDRLAALRIAADGEVEAVWVEPEDGVRFLGPYRSSALWAVAGSLTVGGGALLDDTRLWHIAPLDPPALRAGATTRDTLRLQAERFGFLQSLRGPIVTTMLRDTLVDGRRLWIGRDSARVEYRERLLDPKRSLDSMAVVERAATGTLRGRFLYDPELGLFRTRHDTLAVSGEAVLRLPHGAVHRTPASFERRTRWTLRSLAEQRAWDDEERRRRRAAAFDVPTEPSGIQAEDDPGWRVERMARDRVWAGPPLDSTEMALYLRYLRDPGLAFASRIDTDPLYENLAGGLVMYPPTLGAPPERTSCTPAACRLVAAERDAAEPRLRQVALVASFVMDPERWVDSLLARRDTSAHLLQPAVLLARGVGATWPAAEKRPIPEPGAGWREWQRWTGVDLDSPLRHGSLPPVRWENTHNYAVRMTERLTGREIGAELREAQDTTRDPIGRLVLRTLALELGALRPTLDEIMYGLPSSDSLDRSEALTALRQRRAERQPADSAVHHQIADQLLAQAIDGDSIWIPGPDARSIQYLQVEMDPDAGIPLFLADVNLPAPLRDRWDRRPDVSVISIDEWRELDPGPGLLLRVGQTTTLGSIAWIDLNLTVRTRQSPDHPWTTWPSGTRFTLLRTADGWMVVSVGGWVS